MQCEGTIQYKYYSFILCIYVAKSTKMIALLNLDYSGVHSSYTCISMYVYTIC